jgi:hypothetical protein
VIIIDWNQTYEIPLSLSNFVFIFTPA